MSDTTRTRFKIVKMVLGTNATSDDLRIIGIRFGMEDNLDIDLDVIAILEDQDVYNCQICNVWCDTSYMHNDVCNDCYQEDDDV